MRKAKTFFIAKLDFVFIQGQFSLKSKSHALEFIAVPTDVIRD